MNITISKETLLHTLELVGRVSTKHITLPILQCVFLQVKDNTITIRATNLEIGIESKIPVTVSEEGDIAVLATTLTQTISCINAKEVVLRTEESVLVIEGGGSITHIKSIPHEEFPTIARITAIGQNGTVAISLNSVLKRSPRRRSQQLSLMTTEQQRVHQVRRLQQTVHMLRSLVSVSLQETCRT